MRIAVLQKTFGLFRNCHDFSRRVGALVAIVSIAAAAQIASAQAFNEYQIKAAFLFNFAQFVDWSRASMNGGEFVIGVLGDDPFKNSLDDTVRGESIDARPFVIKRYRSVRDAIDCQILFVSGSEARQLPNILDALRNRSMLTVSDADDFARRGGMVQFITENKRIKFMINVDAVRAANLTISSKLLRPAIIVSSEKG